MALPSKANVSTLDYIGPWGPAIRVTAKGEVTEVITAWGPAYFLSSGAVSDPTNVVYVKTAASTWSTVTNVYVKTAGSTWSEVDDFYIKTDVDWND